MENVIGIIPDNRTDPNVQNNKPLDNLDMEKVGEVVGEI